MSEENRKVSTKLNKMTPFHVGSKTITLKELSSVNVILIQLETRFTTIPFKPSTEKHWKETKIDLQV